jgi:hypothetical protein
MINRRQSLGLMAGALMVGQGTTALAADTAGKGRALDLSTPDNLLTALVKLRAGTNGELAIEWLTGVQYGVVDSVMTPFFTVNSVTVSAYRPAADGSYQGRRLEVVYYGDLATNRRIREFRNPYNGRMVEVPMDSSGTLPVFVNRSGLVLPPRLGDKRLEAESSIGPVVSGGQHVWIRFDTRSRLFDPGASRPGFVYNESTTYKGLLTEVEDPAVTMASCQVSYLSLLGWKPWMAMGDIAGCLTNSANGEKVGSVAELPANLAEFLRTEHPDIYRDPRAALEAAPKKA